MPPLTRHRNVRPLMPRYPRYHIADADNAADVPTLLLLAMPISRATSRARCGEQRLRSAGARRYARRKQRAAGADGAAVRRGGVAQRRDASVKVKGAHRGF